MTISEASNAGSVGGVPPASNPLGFLEDEIAELKRANLYRPMRVLSSPQAAEVVVDGREVEEPYDSTVDLVLDEVGTLAKQFGNARIVIEGHTDGSMKGSVPAGSL